VVRDLPFGFHKQAAPAAVASLCASEQGGFWPMRARLFEAAQGVAAGEFESMAADIGLNASTFAACVESQQKQALVTESRLSAEAMGITGTPTFVLGRSDDEAVAGDVIVGAQPYAAFKARIDRLLAEAG
tara:strand:+ start:2327 stop:2716 length:390 start_codon:yes stop_codon:yes gene_type:complete